MDLNSHRTYSESSNEQLIVRRRLEGSLSDACAARNYTLQLHEIKKEGDRQDDYVKKCPKFRPGPAVSH